MILIEDWRAVLRRAWSIKLIFIAGFFSGLEVAIPFFEWTMPRGLFALLSFVTANGAFVARILAQKEVHSGSKE